MPDKTDARAKARFRLGTTIFIIGFCSPVLIPFVTATDLPLKWKATLSGALEHHCHCPNGQTGFPATERDILRFHQKIRPA
jgi:hypothetical protein